MVNARTDQEREQANIDIQLFHAAGLKTSLGVLARHFWTSRHTGDAASDMAALSWSVLCSVPRTSRRDEPRHVARDAPHRVCDAVTFRSSPMVWSASLRSLPNFGSAAKRRGAPRCSQGERPVVAYPSPLSGDDLQPV